MAQENRETLILVDGARRITAKNRLYRGLGMISANNSSRLLLDYKAEQLTRYWEILRHLFGTDGLCMTHLKLEMGSDINSSSGTEPAVKRSEEETADVTRGAGFQLAADAKQINPELTLDLLWWSEPAWVSHAADRYDARYRWYRETLIAAYQTYGLVFDYVSANRNERAVEPEWICYFVERLKAERDCPYPFSRLKLVAADEEGRWEIAAQMLADERLRAAVDVVGSHYIDWATPEALTLAQEHQKELWFSEGSAPMCDAEGQHRLDGSGLLGVNGLLDIANRIIMMVPCGAMTLYEFQPAVAAYYDGVTYCHKQLIQANTPWSGYYTLDSGYYMALHFARFLKKGWQLIDGACAGDGKRGGDGHAVVDANYAYLTAADGETGAYSIVICNPTTTDRVYRMKVRALARAATPVSVWETRGRAGERYDAGYFQKIGSQIPQKCDDGYTYTVTVRATSLVTISTLDAAQVCPPPKEAENTVLPLPYTDDFAYATYGEDYLQSRGGAPRYMTDIGGAFEVEQDAETAGSGAVLRQKITAETKAEEWGATPAPVTNFGDDRWFNYSVSVQARFSPDCASSENYVGVGLRYHLADIGVSGFSLRLYADGAFSLLKDGQVLRTGHTMGSLPEWIQLRLTAEDNRVCAYVDDAKLLVYDGGMPVGRAAEDACERRQASTGNILEQTETQGKAGAVSGGEDTYASMPGAGRAALYSAYARNCFRALSMEALGETPYVKRLDDTDAALHYEGAWTHHTMTSFRSYHRTESHGAPEAALTFAFTGSGYALLGTAREDCVLKVWEDGAYLGRVSLPETADRTASFFRYGLQRAMHTVRLVVETGNYILDAVELV